MSSRLFNIQPIGIGTPEVESLTGYIKRLAEAHSVRLSSLFRKEIIPDIGRDYIDFRSIISTDSSLNTTDSGISKTVIDILEEKTCNTNLKYLTMAMWKNCFHTNNMFRKIQAWCPICYEENKQSVKTIYEKLIWNFQAIETCKKHHVGLAQRCPFCNNEISIIQSHSQVGYCDRCHSWLGSEGNCKSYLENEEWHDWVYDNIGQLFTCCTMIKELNGQQFSNNVNSIMNCNSMTQESFARELNTYQRKVACWKLGYKPSLYDALKLSFRYGYSLCDIFTKDINMS